MMNVGWLSTRAVLPPARARVYNGCVERRKLLLLLLSGTALPGAEPGGTSLRGKLTKSGDKPALQTREGKLILLTGDEDTLGVISDARLAGSDFEVVGKLVAPDRFHINPIHTHAMHVHKNGKRLMATYWCDVCSIRTYTPGICWCCREETALDLREPDKIETK